MYRLDSNPDFLPQPPGTHLDDTEESVAEYIRSLQQTRGDGYRPDPSNYWSFRLPSISGEELVRWEVNRPTLSFRIGCQACQRVCSFGESVRTMGERPFSVGKLVAATERLVGGSLFTRK